MIKRLAVLLLALSVVTVAHARTHGGGNAASARRIAGGGSSTPIAATSWAACSGVIAQWGFDSPETTASTADNAQGSALRDLADNASATRASSAGTFTAGDQSLVLASASSQFMSVTATNADALDQSGGSITVGCDVYAATDGDFRIFDKMNASRGVRFDRKATNDLATCEFGNGTRGTATAATSSVPITTWTNVYCIFDHSAAVGSEVRIAINGAASGTAGSKTAWDITGAHNVRLGASPTGTLYMNGKLDRCFAYAAALTDAEGARATNCGTLAAEFCKCDSVDPTQYFACSDNSDCGGAGICTSSKCKGNGRTSATMADCNAGCPS